MVLVELEEMNEYLDEFEVKYFIRLSTSSWGARMILTIRRINIFIRLIGKKDGGKRLRINYRELNEV